MRSAGKCIRGERSRDNRAFDVKDPDPDTRANALISLHHLNDPAWRDVARQFLTDPAASPRKMAAAMLAQGAKVMQ